MTPYTDGLSRRSFGEGFSNAGDVRGLDESGLNLPLFAVLTFQEYSYQPHAETIDAFLCDAFGLCGGGNA